MNEQHLKEDIFKILRLLASGGNHTQRGLSNHLNISLGKTNYLLKELTKKGLVKIKKFVSKDNKLKRVSYILTPQGLGEKVHLTYYFLKKKEQEYLALKRELGLKDRTKVEVEEGAYDEQ